MSTDSVTSVTLGDLNTLSVGVDSSIAVPSSLSVSFSMTNRFPSAKAQVAIQRSASDYTVANSSIARISGSSLVGVSPGSTALNTTVLGQSASIPVNVTGNLENATITLSQTSFTYDGSAKTPSITVYFNGSKLTKDTDYTVTYSNNVNAGTAYIRLTGCGLYTGEATATFQIARAQVAAPAAKSGLRYTGRSQTGVAGGTGYTVVGGTATNAGDYTATATLDKNHVWLDGSTNPVTRSWSIARATYDMSGVSFASKSVVYNGKKQYVRVSGTLPQGVTVSYTDNSGTDVGTHNATATFTGDSTNYEAIAPMTATLTITKATYDMSGVSFKDKSVTYTGGEQYLRITGTLPQGVSVSYTDNYGTDVGAYNATATFTGDSTNYEAIAPMTATLTITKATYDMSGVSFKDKSVTYTGERQYITISGTPPQGVSVMYSSGWAIDAGVYKATAIFVGDPINYKIISSMKATLTITKATYDMSGVSFKDKSVTYDGKKHSLEITGALPQGVSVSYEGNDVSEVGAHTVTASFTGDSANYKAIAPMTATLTIKSASKPDSTPTPDPTPSPEPTPAPDPASSSIRLAGAGRYDTMLEIVKAESASTKGGTVVLATGANFPDALAASGLAGLGGGSIVLTDPNSLSDQARSALEKLEPSKIYIAGGTAAVSRAVERDATAYAPVERCAGEGRIGTAEEIYAAGSGWGGTCIIATAYNYADALAVSPLAYARHYPIFLANADGELDASTAAIVKGGFDEAVIVGGTAVVSNAVKSQIPGVKVTRLAGANRYETASAIVDYEIGTAGMSCAGMAVATGANYPDALAGSSLCGSTDSVLCLMDGSGSDVSGIAGVIKTRKGSIGKVYILGGESAVSKGAKAAIDRLLG